LDRNNIEEALEDIKEAFGPVDILINAAGGNHPKGTTSAEEVTKDVLADKEATTFFDLDPEGVQFVFNLNFIGTLLPTQILTQDMAKKGEGVVINISSMSAFAPLTKVPAYSAAKAAVSNFTQWLAVHMAKTGIRVNAIAPGFFLTDQNRTLLTEKDGSLTARGNKIISQTPMERFGDPEDLIGTLLWLISDDASRFVTGTVIPVDGGFSAYSGV
jgi:NAD(P)-dependent dehydrogenase (short-subunit alcohol dehydrogenase family)